MLAKGIHPKIVSERRGYSDMGITGDFYSYVIPSMQEEAVSHFGTEWRRQIGSEEVIIL